MPFLPPNQQRQSTAGITSQQQLNKLRNYAMLLILSHDLHVRLLRVVQ